MDSIQSDSSGGEFNTPVILDYCDVTEQETYKILNDIDMSSVISLNEELAYLTEKEDTTSPAVFILRRFRHKR